MMGLILRSYNLKFFLKKPKRHMTGLILHGNKKNRMHSTNLALTQLVHDSEGV